MKKKHKLNAFVLADSLVALAILMMVLAWLAVCEKQLKVQREKMSTTLRVVRLAKESSDGLLLGNNQKFVRRDGPYQAVATSRGVSVSRDGHLLWEMS